MHYSVTLKFRQRSPNARFLLAFSMLNLKVEWHHYHKQYSTSSLRYLGQLSYRLVLFMLYFLLLKTKKSSPLTTIIMFLTNDKLHKN